MSKFIFNNSGSTRSYQGMSVDDQAYLEVPAVEEYLWAGDSTLIVDIANAVVIVSKTNAAAGHIVDVSDGINYLKNLDQSVKVIGQPAFADKKTADGKSLYVRDKGMEFTVSVGANNNKQCNIDYPTVKFNGIEIIGGEVGDKVDLKVLDTPTGTISTLPNYLLNQFGFNVNVSPGYYHRESKYDADLIQNMKIVVDYESVSAKTVYINFIIHEVK